MKNFTKKAVPIFLALVFMGSVLAVFSYGGEREEVGKARLIINFNQPNMEYESELTFVENQSALRLLSSYATYLEVEAGNVKCIADYCNTKTSEWKFYTVESTVFGGYEETKPGVSPEGYIVQTGDLILFRYEQLINEETENGVSEVVINETTNITE